MIYKNKILAGVLLLLVAMVSTGCDSSDRDRRILELEGRKQEMRREENLRGFELMVRV